MSTYAKLTYESYQGLPNESDRIDYDMAVMLAQMRINKLIYNIKYDDGDEDLLTSIDLYIENRIIEKSQKKK